MSYSLTTTNTQTFTLTHAKYLSSKVAADLKRIQRLYDYPTDAMISDYEEELTLFLKSGYLSEVTYGFQRNGNWIEPTLRYTARDLSGMTSGDDDPGKIRPNANVSGASFTSYLIKIPTYYQLSESERESFEKSLPFKRNGAPLPGISGYVSSDKTYSAGGQALDRSTIKSF